VRLMPMSLVRKNYCFDRYLARDKYARLPKLRLTTVRNARGVFICPGFPASTFVSLHSSSNASFVEAERIISVRWGKKQ
jgi:hypothetical protein